MNELPDQSHASPSAPSTPSACDSRACCPLQGRSGLLLWAALILGIAYVQWPMLKGTFYKVTDSKAPASAIAWRSSFDAALAESAKTGKPILADFSASWCPPCRVMKHDVWPDAAVAAAANKSYVPLLMDADDSHTAEIAQRYGVQSIPTILVLDAKGQVLRSGSYMSKGEMLDFLKSST